MSAPGRRDRAELETRERTLEAALRALYELTLCLDRQREHMPLDLENLAARPLIIDHDVDRASHHHSLPLSRLAVGSVSHRLGDKQYILSSIRAHSF
jgi:hypothetical protein